MPDAFAPGDLVTMCGSVPTTTEDWERCRLKRFCETLVPCSEGNLYASAQECIDLINALSWDEIAFDAFESARSVAAGRASVNVAAFTQPAPRRLMRASAARKGLRSLAEARPMRGPLGTARR